MPSKDEKTLAADVVASGLANDSDRVISPDGGALVGEEETDDVQSRSVTPATLASTSTTVTVTATQSQGKGKASALKKVEEAEEKKIPRAEANNLIGKINNLVTSDLSAIAEGRDFLWIGTSYLIVVDFMSKLVSVVAAPVQMILSLGFLYTILGWR